LEWVCFNAGYLAEPPVCSGLQVVYSVGCHPWHALIYDYHPSSRMEAQLRLPGVWALGEIGLDKARGPSIDIQTKVFEHQFFLAQAQAIPIVVHCVRAFAELIPYLKKSKVPLAFHGFRGNVQKAKAVTEVGGFVSFGEALCFDSGLHQVLAAIDPACILLETDDSELGIEVVYQKAAQILKMDLPELKDLIKNNALRFFGKRPELQVWESKF